MLISCTITDSREATIRGALESVLHSVDLCLVVDTGVKDRTLEVAREVCGDKLRVACFPWVDDFSAARNFALDAAHQLGGKWALNVDSDERIEVNGEDLRIDAPVGMLRPREGTYVKEHVFRLPRQHGYSGRTHECYPSQGCVVLDKARTWEVPKTPAEQRAKFERDARLLYGQTDSRSHFYRGVSLEGLGRLPEAIDAYRACYECDGWDEESAWACYLAASLSVRLGRLEEGFDFCIRGLGRHAGVAELAWYAGYIRHRQGRHEQAIYWSKMSAAMGLFRGAGAEVLRIGFRHPPGLHENPFDVMHWAYKALGKKEEAEAAYRLYLAARSHA